MMLTLLSFCSSQTPKGIVAKLACLRAAQACFIMCRSLGCLDPQCVLCEHNPHRRCNVNFAPKYLVNDVLKAKCDAPIRVEIIDRQTGVPLGEDIADVHLEVGHCATHTVLPAKRATEISMLCHSCEYSCMTCGMASVALARH
jgi:hypothetical protein